MIFLSKPDSIVRKNISMALAYVFPESLRQAMQKLAQLCTHCLVIAKGFLTEWMQIAADCPRQANIVVLLDVLCGNRYAWVSIVEQSVANEKIIIGLNSGPAFDGVDAAAVVVRGAGERMKVSTVGHCRVDYVPTLRARLARAAEKTIPPDKLADLAADVTTFFAQAVEDIIALCELNAGSVRAIATEGQTGIIAGGVLQPEAIAQDLQIPVISCFSKGSIAAGGLGSPMGAWADWLLFRHKRCCRTVVRLGHIARLTFIGSASLSDDVIAFDVGPCSAACDSVAREHFDCDFDADGAIAARGKLNPALLNELLSNPYFGQSPPKACKPAQWANVYAQRLGLMADKHRCQPADLMTTVCEMIAVSIVRAIGRMTERPHDVILAGGGARNIHLASRIRELMCPAGTVGTEKHQIPASAYAAVCYGILGAARLSKFAAYCRHEDGASRRVVLGSVVLG